MGIIGYIYWAARGSVFRGDEGHFFTRAFTQHVQKCQGHEFRAHPWEVGDAFVVVLDLFSRCDAYPIRESAKGRVVSWWP